MHATTLWSLWQGVVLSLAAGFATRRGIQRFVEWVTGLALDCEERTTTTQSLVGLDRVGDWKALESFAEYGHWDLRDSRRHVAWHLAQRPDRAWHGYQVWAGDDTKVHRSSPGVWGTCTFHEYTARSPNRAGTVRAHNWVVVGALVPHPGGPADFLPTGGRLYFRRTQLPFARGAVGARVPFRTKCELLVELGREQARAGSGRTLGVVDGGFALRSVVRPLVRPEDPTQPRVDVLTRLRRDARLYALPPGEREPGRRGASPKWGPRLPPPRQGGRRPGAWQTRSGVPLRPLASGGVQDGGRPVAGPGARRPGPGGGRPGGGLPPAVHPGDHRHRPDRAADGGTVLCPVPTGGRVSRPEAAAGVGGVPGVDPQPDRADDAGGITLG